MASNTQRIGWIGMGRMGYPMAERLLKAGYDVSIWNRTRAKAEPLAKLGGKIVDKPSDLAMPFVVVCAASADSTSRSRSESSLQPSKVVGRAASSARNTWRMCSAISLGSGLETSQRSAGLARDHRSI